MSMEFSWKNLPPIGLVCEVQLDDGSGFQECEIIAHYDPCNDGDKVAICAVKSPGGRLVHQRIGPCFRMAKTTEDPRVKAIREMAEQMAGYKNVEEPNDKMISLSTYLYDAGYRKFEIVEEDV